jgi:hypothetical protein
LSVDDHCLALEQARQGASLSANAGISVWKRAVGFEPPYDSLTVKVPWTTIPLDVISLT